MFMDGKRDQRGSFSSRHTLHSSFQNNSAEEFSNKHEARALLLRKLGAQRGGVCALPPRLIDGWQPNRGMRHGQAAMLGLAMTVMIHASGRWT